jgi:YD repeat-containing protein
VCIAIGHRSSIISAERNDSPILTSHLTKAPVHRKQCFNSVAAEDQQMIRMGYKALFMLVLLSVLAVCVQAQTATYRLHKEASTTTGHFQLKTANPDGTSLAIQSANLKGVAAGEYLVKAFDTQSGVPNTSGTIPAGSTITFSLWLRKTTTGGTIYPRAKLRLNTATGTLLGTATGATALSSTLTKYTFTTTTGASVTMSATDRFYVWVGVNLTAAPTTNTTAELDIEGTLNGNYDSLVTVPLPIRPTVNSISPTVGPAGTNVTLNGANFGNTQGTSTITFNGVNASPTGWSAGSIVAPVPSGATTGAVVVTVNGAASNSQTFTVGDVGAFTGTVSRTVDGAPIAGAQIKAIQSGVVKGTTTSGSNGAYSLTNLLAGIYDVQAVAGGHGTQTQTGQQLTPQSSNTINFALTSIYITYIYDELGRLVGAVDPNGETAKYTYDAVGNLTSISRHSSSQLSIIEFSPNGGAIGTPVNIYGTGFSSTPSQNTVKFNGVTATVASSTSTQIVASVPAGATTGLITVTTSAGTATSSTAFTVGNPSAPTITSFTPNAGSPGTSVTLTGTNFQTVPSSNKVAFNGINAPVSSATATSIVTTVPSGAASGRLSVRTPDGKAVSVNDFYIPPPPYAGTDVEFTGRIAFGETKVVTINTANKIAMLLFDATAGQRMCLTTSNGSIGWAYFSIIKPDGSYLINPGWGNNGVFYDATVLPATGTYTIVLDPENANIGSLTFTLTDVPPDATGTITPGGPAVTISTTTMAQNARVTFSGTANQRISLATSNGTIGWAYFSIIKPDGSYLITPGWGNNGVFYDATTLPATGTYTIVIDPEYGNVGSLTLQLYDVPPDATGTITPGGPAVTISTTSVAQNARLTFSGTANQRISLATSNGSIGWAYFSIIKPDGSYLINPGWGNNGVFYDVTVLPATGTYTIVIDPEYTNVGSLTLQLYDVPPDTISAITPGGSSVTISTTSVAQNARLTFSGTANQRISLTTSNGSIGWAYFSIIKPDGSYLINPGWGHNGAFFDATILPDTGTYTIVIDPEYTNVGSLTLQLYDVPPDATNTIIPGGAAVTISNTTVGQNATLTFSGSANQTISLNMGNGTMGWALVSIIKPDGSYLINPAWTNGGGFFGATVLPTDGTYTIFINPEYGNVGSMTFTLNNVSSAGARNIAPARHPLQADGSAAVPLLHPASQVGVAEFRSAAHDEGKSR